METIKSFTILDFIVFFGIVSLSPIIGIYFGWRSRNKNTVKNYFLGNRKLSVISTALSLAVTFQSSLLIIGVPAEVYSYGLKYAYYLIGSCSSYFFAGLVIVPVIHPLKLTSANKYFKIRLGNNRVRYLVMSFGYFLLYPVFRKCDIWRLRSLRVSDGNTILGHYFDLLFSHSSIHVRWRYESCHMDRRAPY